ncbi:MarR family transcriptional regulator [Caldibacillus debilis]|uniref:MarR family winged helix-turn-helix transcriptional regulator n=1 Tax=Caldibacillus debilis TaxID=301148 RepID=UPI002FD8E9EC
MNGKFPGTTRDERLGILLWYRLSRFYNRSVRLSNQHLKKWGLTLAQFDCLVHIGTNERICQRDLAEKLLVTKGNIAQILAKMEKAGWIKREKEWRTNYLSLTEKGKKLLEAALPEQERFQAAQFSPLSAEEKKRLLAYLRKLQKQWGGRK